MSESLTSPLRRVCQSLEREAFRSMSDRQLLERFAGGDDAAFAAIVERHGPLVRAVSLRALRDSSQVDDAFQAVFVLLARKSRSLRRPEALAGWLFSVARKIAGQMRLSHARLRRREQLAASQRPECHESKPWDDLLRVLDEELNRLPERLRAPLVACYLQGRTQDEAARELGWPLITLRRRLAAGRERLRLRMDRRGATLSAGLLAAALTPAVDAAVPAALAQTTLTHAIAALHGDAIPTAIAELARDSTIGSIGVAKLWLAPMVAACVLVGIGMFRPWSERPLPALRPDPPPERPKVALRDRFNDPLPDGAVARLGTISLRHGSEVFELHFAPDGKSLYSRGGGMIRQWQVSTGNETQAIDMRQHPPYEVRTQVISADGKTVAAVIGNRFALPPVPERLEIWDANSMEKLREFTINIVNGTTFGVERARVSPGGRYLAVKRSSMMVMLWDCLQSKLIFTTPGWARILAFSYDDRYLITTDGKFNITIWESATGRVVKQLGNNESQPTAAVMSSDGKWLATAGFTLGESRTFGKNLAGRQVTPDRFIRLWNVEKGELSGKIEAETFGEMPFAFAPDSKSILLTAPASRIGEICVQRVAIPAGTTISTFPDHLPSRGVIAISPNGKIVAHGYENGTVRLWDLDSKEELHKSEGHAGRIKSLEFASDGSKLISRDYQNSMIEWDLQTSSPIRTDVERAPLGLGTWFDDGRFRVGVLLHVDPAKSRMIVMDVARKRVLRDFGTAPAGLTWVAVIQEGKQLITASGDDADKLVQILEIASNKVVSSWRLQNGPGRRPEIRYLSPTRLLINQNDKVIVRETATGKALCEWSLTSKGVKKDDKHFVTFFPSSNADSLACAVQEENQIVICETMTGGTIRRFVCPDLAPWPTAFSPDGKFIAACGGGLAPVIHVWDISSGREMHRFTGHRGDISCLAFRKDGKRLASGSADSTVLIWDLTKERQKDR